MSLALARIRLASDYLARAVGVSPLVAVDGWRTPDGAPILVKADNLLPTGSFKIRGASWRVSNLTPAQRARGVVAYSTGNHAQAVAKAAHDAGIEALVVMSPDAPPAKVEATRSWGATVAMSAPSSDARRALATALAAERGLTLIPPYDDTVVMEGQASIGVEILAQLHDRPPAAIFVPIGGGGLLAGVAAALAQLAPRVAVIGVEPELENDACRSFHSGRLVTMAAPSASIADAIKVQSLGHLTFPLIREYVDDIVTVSEQEIASASLRYFCEARLVVEPGGAVALAAALRCRRALPADAPVVVLACGGNVTLERLAQLRALAAGGPQPQPQPQPQP